MNKKHNAEQFLKIGSTNNVQEVFAKFVHSEFIHHNLHFKGDRESLLQAMEENAKRNPDITYEVVQSLEDEDLVSVHGKVTFPDDSILSLIHIFRFKGDKIVEAWEGSQEEIKDSKNEHGLF